MRKRMFLIATIFLIVVSATSVIAQSKSGPFNATGIVYTLTDWTNALVFPKFDTALGTLIEVDMEVTGTIDTILTVTNQSPEASNGYAKTECELTVVDPGALLSLYADIISSPQFNYNLASGETVTSDHIVTAKKVSDSWTDASILDEFKGPGNISMTAKTLTSTLINVTGGNTIANQTTLAKADGKVTYWYNPVVPEPSSMIALFTGILAVGAVRFRKR